MGDERGARRQPIEERQRPEGVRRRRPVQKKGMPPGLMIVMIALLCLVLAGGYYVWNKYAPNRKQVEWFAVEAHEAYDEDKPVVVVGGVLQPPDAAPVVRDGVLYMPVSFVREEIDPTLFWDGAANRLTITTPTRLIRMRTDELTYYVNSEELSLNLSALQIDGEAYMPAALLMELYHVDIALYENTGNAPEVVVVDDEAVSRELGETKKITALRVEPDKKSSVLCDVESGTALTLYDAEGDWTFVRTATGLLGYMQTKDIAETGAYEGVPAPREEAPPPPVLADGGKINLLWDQMENMTASTNAARRTMYKGLDVISPTWFSFDLDALNGDIVSLADQSYVEWAHANGLQVWALFSDNFDARVSRDVLSDTEKREHVIRQILAFVAMYRLDGINIDFENVRRADVAHYHQFLRELAPMLREQNVTLSVDMYVPMPYSMYYDRAEVARVADYVVVMAYDEYGTHSETAGPVASIGFVHEGILGTLEEVPADKLILAVPFYARMWCESEEGLTSRAWGMSYTRQLLEDNGAEIIWDEAAGSFYGEYTIREDGVDKRYRAWLEDEHSMEERLKLVQQYDLAGVGSWRKGLEKEEIWDLFERYLENE